MKLVFRKWLSLKLGAKRIFLFFSPRLSYLLHSHLFIERSLIMRTIMIVCIIKKYKEDQMIVCIIKKYEEDQSIRKQDKTKQKYKTEGKNKNRTKEKKKDKRPREGPGVRLEKTEEKKKDNVTEDTHGTAQYSTSQNK